jgi:asparagine synthase (glutamine-hydrolysing)
MVADVPVGAFLSGGIDSSIVVALMQARARRPVRTFSIGFETEEYDEAPHAKRVADALGSDHTEFYLTAADALSVVPMLPEIYDEPFADPSQIPTYLVSQMARSEVTVALTGDGGDESFGGYQRYTKARRLAALYRLPRQIRQAASRCLTAISAKGWDQGLAACRPLLAQGLARSISGERIYNLASVAELTNSTDMYRREVSLWQTPSEIVIGGHEPSTPLSILDWRDEGIGDFTSWMMCIDTMTYLPGDILVKVDRASMAASLEVRCPLLDHRVVEFAWRLPSSMKVRSGRGKWILRQVLARYVPPALFERPKQGFAVPIAMWLRGPLREWAEELLDETKLRRDGFFYPRPIRQAWLEHLAGGFDRSGLLWNVLMFQAWSKRWHAL